MAVLIFGSPIQLTRWSAQAHKWPYMRALDYRFTADDEALVDKLVASGHPSTPGYNDPQYPIEGRRAR